ncbi:hypothetical protein MMC30_009305 [Trapelia coarctata]|nr:hypothetical protein [Trapelia coarctata]
MKLLQVLLALAAYASVGIVRVEAAPYEAEKRAICNHDSVLRALLANSAAATGFCSAYITIKDTTVTVLGTNPPPTPITETTTTQTATFYTYPPQYAPYLVPTYLFPYATSSSRISSACSCLSILPMTQTDYEYYPTPTATTITTTTTTAGVTGACVTETLFPGAFHLSSSASDAFEHSFGPDEQNPP